MGRDPDSGWDDEKERRDQASAEAQRRDEMTDVDVSKIKVGDVVGFTVRELGIGTVQVGETSTCPLDEGWLPTSAIVSHTPAPKPALKVGDMLQRSPGSLHRLVIWIECGWAYFSPIEAGQPARPLSLSEVETWERV